MILISVASENGEKEKKKNILPLFERQKLVAVKPSFAFAVVSKDFSVLYYSSFRLTNWQLVVVNLLFAFAVVLNNFAVSY